MGEEGESFVYGLGRGGIVLFPCDVFLRLAFGRSIVECGKTKLFPRSGVKHAEVVAPSGAGYDKIGLEHVSGFEKQCVVLDVGYVVTDDF